MHSLVVTLQWLRQECKVSAEMVFGELVRGGVYWICLEFQWQHFVQQGSLCVLQKQEIY